MRCHVAGCNMHILHCLREIPLRTVGWPWNWGWGHSRSSKVRPFDSLGMISYSTSTATMAVSCTVSEIHQTYWSKIALFSHPLYSARPLGVKPSELSNNPRWKTRVMGLSGGKRISTKSLAVLIQSTRVTQTHRQTDRNAVTYTRASIVSCR